MSLVLGILLYFFSNRKDAKRENTSKCERNKSERNVSAEIEFSLTNKKKAIRGALVFSEQ